MASSKDHIQQLVVSHEAWRAQTINMIASENALSPTVRSALNSDLIQRYGDYTGRDLSARRYRGNHFIEQIERETVEIAQKVFRARFIELRPVSGHIAGAAVLMGLCHPGDVVLEPGRDGGGHREAGKLVGSTSLPYEVCYLPFDAQNYNIDVPATIKMIEQKRPKVVILGSSNFLFPHPVAEIAAALKQYPDTVLVYDASHVMGFVAAGAFQDPLAEGADVVFGSTHKTFPGPQGGIIFSNREDLITKISDAAYPALVTNHHLFRIPALAFALLEMQQWGKEYTTAIVENAQALGSALEKEGVHCVCVNGRYSLSHTLLACVSPFCNGAVAAERLEAAGIITTAAHLPEYWGSEGVRIGVQEITRLGARPADMALIAGWMTKALSSSSDTGELVHETAHFAAQLGPVQFTWDK